MKVTESLMFVSGYVYRLLRYEARRQKIRWTALMVLKDLDLLGPVSQRTLCDIEQVTAPTMTVLIREMTDRGLIKKNLAADARVNLVSITPKGRRELRSKGRVLRRRLQKELAHIPGPIFRALERPLAALSLELSKLATAT